MKKFVSTVVLMLAISPILVHNLYKYRSKQRNTTQMKASKIRWTGNTGFAGEYYYDNSTHTLHDKEDYL